MDRLNNFKKLLNIRLLSVLLFGFSSGLPLALVMGTLQAWFRDSGIDIKSISLLGAVGLPYTYKFLWAPVLDRFTLPFLSKRRGWILLSQIGLIITILAMSTGNPTVSPGVLATLAVILAILSATQDMAIDAYRAEILRPDERGLGAALATEGYRIAMLASGAMGLILADHIGYQKTYMIMSSMMLIGVITSFIAPSANSNPKPDKYFYNTIANAFTSFLTRKNAILFLALIILYKLGDAFSHILSTPFLQDLEFSKTSIGVINKTVGLAASLIGVFFGGILMTRIGLFTSLLFFGVLQAVTNLTYMCLAIVGKNYTLAATAFFIENLCGGMGTAALVALLMALCDHKYTATQFAIFTSVSAIGRTLVAPIGSGFIVEAMGWANFYFASAIFAIPGIIIIYKLKNDIIELDSDRIEIESNSNEPKTAPAHT